MSEVKEVKKDVLVEAVAAGLESTVTVKDKEFVFSDDAVEKAIAAFNEERGEKKTQLTTDTLKAAHEFQANLEAAVVLAAGKKGLEAMKADKELTKIEGELKFGTGKIEVKQMREHQTRNPAYKPEVEGSQEFICQNGKVKTEISIQGEAALKRARNQIIELAKDYL